MRFFALLPRLALLAAATVLTLYLAVPTARSTDNGEVLIGAGLVLLAIAAAARGWYGFELAIAAVRRKRPAEVIDVVTGGPLRHVSWKHLRLNEWLVHRVGYESKTVKIGPFFEGTVYLQPKRLRANRFEAFALALLLYVGWSAVVATAVITMRLYEVNVALAWVLLGLTVAVSLAQAWMAVYWPRTRWARLSPAHSGLEVEVAGGKQGIAVRAHVDAKGYFAAHLAPGKYVVRGGIPGKAAAAVVHMRRKGYMSHQIQL